ncbi:MAG TPA: hypothetical protein DCY07_00485 [Rhodospirillaceae bacterium]|nr:hypothetical protein [Rhodospirillaceae bacterium]
MTTGSNKGTHSIKKVQNDGYTSSDTKGKKSMPNSAAISLLVEKDGTTANSTTVYIIAKNNGHTNISLEVHYIDREGEAIIKKGHTTAKDIEPKDTHKIYIGKIFLGGQTKTITKILIDGRPVDAPFILEPITELPDSMCAVTTAAYGDSMHPMVCAFRGLRDEMMVNFPSGRGFTNWYNKNGPKMAKVLEDYPFLKPISCAVLTPLAKTVLITRKVIDKSPRLRSFFYTPR